MPPLFSSVRGARATGVASRRVNIDAFLKSLDDIELAWSPQKMQRRAEGLAREILAKAVKAPIPRDTGALARSGTVVPGARAGSVVFGFNRPYAAVQDVGGVNLPPKFFGSRVGPNFYFSETLRRAGPEAFARLAQLAREDLFNVARQARKRAGGRR